MRANLARQLVTRSPDKAEELLRSLRSDVDRTLDDLAELTRGMVPAALTQLGLVDALRAQASRAAVPVDVEASGAFERVPDDVRTAIYFSALEALQNVAKYANATRATVRLRATEDEVVFEVQDDGRGFDASTTSPGTGMRGMAERLAAVRGRLDVRSGVGAGTTVTGRVPTGNVDGARRGEDREPIGAGR